MSLLLETVMKYGSLERKTHNSLSIFKFSDEANTTQFHVTALTIIIIIIIIIIINRSYGSQW